jgi:hypothetical protein
MGFLDDLKKAADSAGQAVQRQVDNLQKTSPPAPPEPPPLEGSPAVAPPQPPVASSSSGVPEPAPQTPVAPPGETDAGSPPAFPVSLESGRFVPPPPPPS